MPTPTLRRPTDHRLRRRAAAGDEAAAREIDARYRAELQRYAASILGRSEHDAEDVVQDVLLTAHLELKEGRMPEKLRPWLYRLVRNRAIDELRRARRNERSLDADAAEDAAGAAGVMPTDERHRPDAAMMRKLAVHELAVDIAALPENQRIALLAREVDGETSKTVGERLSISAEAAQMLVVRARRALVSARDGRDERLLDVQLRSLAAPAGLLAALGVGPAGLLGKLALPALGLGAAATAATAAVVVGPGLTVREVETPTSGEASPITIRSLNQYTGRAPRGAKLPAGTTMVSAVLDASPAAARGGTGGIPVTLTCPEGQRFVHIETSEGAGWGMRADPVPQEGISTSVHLDAFPQSRGRTTTRISILCRPPERPDALRARVAAKDPAPSGSTPEVLGINIVHRARVTPPDPEPELGPIIVSVRLSRPIADGSDGPDLYGDLGDGDVRHLFPIARTAPGKHCYQLSPAGEIDDWRPGMRIPVRLWVGDGDGRATRIERSVAVPRPPTADDVGSRSLFAGYRLGCLTP